MFDTKGFNEKTTEKIYRICDILQRISLVEYTQEKLSLYGGTSLNFLHFKYVPRLSIDIDFNFRDLKTGDWEQERNKIDDILKKILYDLKYSESNIKIQASYPITRFDINYLTENKEKDSIKMEIGYMRRMPLFKNDIKLIFNHFKSGEPIELKTPMSEELFGNKFCTFLYRYEDETTISSKDLYDVYMISKSTFNKKLFETAIILDSLMRPEPRLYKKDIKKIAENISINNQLLNLIRNGEIPRDLKPKSEDFINKYIIISKEKYQDVLDTFFDKHIFDPKLLKTFDSLNPEISFHPCILWNLKKLEI